MNSEDTLLNLSLYYCTLIRSGYQSRYHPTTSTTIDRNSLASNGRLLNADYYNYTQNLPPCKLHHPELYDKDYPADSTDSADCNKYGVGPACNGGGALDARPLPSLPRSHQAALMATTSTCNPSAAAAMTVGSTRSMASGSDASLHWGDTPPRSPPSVPSAGGSPPDGASQPPAAAAGQGEEDDYLVPRSLMASTAASLASDGSPGRGIQGQQSVPRPTPQNVRFMSARASLPAGAFNSAQLYLQQQQPRQQQWQHRQTMATPQHRPNDNNNGTNCTNNSR